MRIRRPSAGLLYLVLTGIGAAVFFDYLTGPFFFEHPNRSAANNLGEARYLMKLARQSSDEKARAHLTTARKLAEPHSDQALIEEIDRMQAELAARQEVINFIEVQPGISLGGFDKSGTTKGPAMGTVRLHNPTAATLRVRLKFETKGSTRGRYVIAGEAKTFALAGVEPPRRGGFLTPGIAPHGTLDIQVGIQAPSKKTPGLPGLRFIGGEIQR